MARLIFWRVARTALAVWALASAVFLLTHRDGGAAVRLALSDAPEVGTAYPDRQPAVLQAMRQRMGFDLPLFYVGLGAGPRAREWRWNGPANQYHRWASGLLRGDLGTSYRTGEAVGARLRTALAYTLPLTATAAVLAVLAALALAQRLAAGPRWQGLVRTALTVGHALPLFVLAVGLLLLFANPEALAWFPAYGLELPGEAEADLWSRSGTYALHLVLPVAALVLAALPELVLQLEAALAQELRAAYATTARAKGLSERAVVRRHALRNALLPSLAQVAELLPALVAGAVVVEVVFALPGMGRLLAAAAAARDYPVLVGGVLLTGGARLLALLVADLLFLWADPRIRWQA